MGPDRRTKKGNGGAAGAGAGGAHSSTALPASSSLASSSVKARNSGGNSIGPGESSRNADKANTNARLTAASPSKNNQHPNRTNVTAPQSAVLGQTTVPTEPKVLSAADRARAAAMAVAAQVSRLNVAAPAPVIAAASSSSASSLSASSLKDRPAVTADGLIDIRAPAVRAALQTVADTKFGSGSGAWDEGDGGEGQGIAALAAEGDGSKPKKTRGLSQAGRSVFSEGSGLRGAASGLLHYATGAGITPAIAPSAASFSRRSAKSAEDDEDESAPAAAAAPSSAPAAASGAALAAASSASVRAALSRSSLLSGGFGLDGASESAPLSAPSRNSSHVARVKELGATAGRDWFDMPAAEMTPELRRELLIIRSRNYLDPKRHYKTSKDDLKAAKGTPKFVQLGVVQESAGEFYSSRLTQAQRKGSLVDQLLADRSFKAYAKKNVAAVQAAATAGGFKAFRKRKSMAAPSWKRKDGGGGGGPPKKRARHDK